MAKPKWLDFQGTLIQALRDPDEAAGYLEAALEEGDPKFLLTALRDVADAQGGLAKLAQKAKLNRVSLYRMLSKTGNPELASLSRLLGSLGLRLAILPLPAPKARTFRKGILATKRAPAASPRRNVSKTRKVNA